MNGYQFAILFILINAGIFLMAGIGVFGDEISEHSTILSWFEDVKVYEDEIGGFGTIAAAIGGGILVVAIAGVMLLGSTRVGNLALGTPQGWAILVFAVMFCGTTVSSLDIMNGFAEHIPGFRMIQGIFLLIAGIIALMAIVQFGGGGTKAHD